MATIKETYVIAYNVGIDRLVKDSDIIFECKGYINRTDLINSSRQYCQANNFNKVKILSVDYSDKVSVEEIVIQ